MESGRTGASGGAHRRPAAGRRCAQLRCSSCTRKWRRRRRRRRRRAAHRQGAAQKCASGAANNFVSMAMASSGSALLRSAPLRSALLALARTRSHSPGPQAKTRQQSLNSLAMQNERPAEARATFLHSLHTIDANCELFVSSTGDRRPRPEETLIETNFSLLLSPSSTRFLFHSSRPQVTYS